MFAFKMFCHDNDPEARGHLIKTRFWFRGLTTLYLVMLACRLMPLDFTKDEDPKIWEYQHMKWKLITSWVNLLMLFHFSSSMYCDWREQRGENQRSHVKVLNTIRNTLFTSIVFPSTIWADTLFWRLWHKDRSLLMPSGVEKYVDIWTHHLLHTLSFVVVVFEVFVEPRKRPRSMKSGIVLLSTFVFSYVAMCTVNWMQGIYIYPVFEMFPVYKLILFAVYMYIEHLFYFTIHWILVDLLWSNKEQKIKTK